MCSSVGMRTRRILLALLASDSLNADLVGWSYPVMPNAWQTPTAPGMVTVPAGVVLDGGGHPAPLRQADGTILVGAETATNQQVLFALKGDPGLGFTVAAPAAFSCGTGVGVTGSGSGGSGGSSGSSGGGGSLDWLLLTALLGAWLTLTRCQKAQAGSRRGPQSAEVSPRVRA